MTWLEAVADRIAGVLGGRPLSVIRPTWSASQRAVEYHVALGTAGHLDRPSCLVLDIDPPAAGEFGRAVAAARLVREALSGAGLAGAVKTSRAKGVHIYVPVQELVSADDAAAATCALAQPWDGGPYSGVHDRSGSG